MVIGMYDSDLVEGTLPKSLNLELMKLSSYFKSKGHIVQLTLKFNPEKYSEFYYFKNSEDSIKDNLYSHTNIFTYGKYFSPQQYNALNIKIESEVPDTSIYNTFFATLSEKQAKIRIHLINSTCHIRLSLDGKTIWKDYEKQILPNKYKKIYLYDYSITSIENAREEILNLLKKFGTKNCHVECAFPIIFHNMDTFIKWKDIPFNSETNDIYYSSIWNDEDTIKFVKECKDTVNKIQYLPCIGGKQEINFLKYELQNILKQAVFFRSNHIHFPLNYRRNFLSDDVRDILELFYTIANSETCIKNFPTVFEYAKYYTNEKPFIRGDYMSFSKPRLRELFLLVNKYNPELYNLFYSCYDVKEEGGKLVVK